VFEADPLAIYAAAARRVHSIDVVLIGVNHELTPVLRLLCDEPSIAALAEHLELLRTELEEVLLCRGMRFSSWDFGRPSIRATARHPLRGITVIECLAEQPPVFEMFAYHWFDDATRAVRCSRRIRFAQTEFDRSLLRGNCASCRPLSPRTR
jgi:hypothetical protein